MMSSSSSSESSLGSKRSRNGSEGSSSESSSSNADSSGWEWKSFSNFACLPGLTLSSGGNPPKERHCVLDEPYEALTLKQKCTARCILGVENEEEWERALPRRVYGNSEYLVLSFQNCTWDDLSKEQQKEAHSELDLTKTIWNNLLAPFHDDLWEIPGITLSQKEFSAVLSALTKMSSRQALTKTELAQFLLDLGRVLKPSQGVAICNTLMHSNCWEILEPPVNHNNLTMAVVNNSQNCSVQSLVASFVSDTERLFTNISNAQLQLFWNDLNSGCTWGSANEDESDTTRPNYASALKNRRDKHLAFRRCVAPLLTGAYPESVPELPKCVALSILNFYIGEEDPVDPRAVKWQLFNESSLMDVLNTGGTGTTAAPASSTN